MEVREQPPICHSLCAHNGAGQLAHRNPCSTYRLPRLFTRALSNPLHSALQALVTALNKGWAPSVIRLSAAAGDSIQAATLTVECRVGSAPVFDLLLALSVATRRSNPSEAAVTPLSAAVVSPAEAQAIAPVGAWSGSKCTILQQLTVECTKVRLCACQRGESTGDTLIHTTQNMHTWRRVGGVAGFKQFMVGTLLYVTTSRFWHYSLHPTLSRTVYCVCVFLLLCAAMVVRLPSTVRRAMRRMQAAAVRVI